MRRSENSRLAAILINIGIAVMMVGLFALTGAYLVLYVRAGQAEERTQFDMRFLTSSTQEAERDTDRALLSPTAVAVKTDGICRAIWNETAVIDELCETLRVSVYSALSGEGTAVPEEEWIRGISAPDAVCLFYAAELPYQILYAFAAAGEADLAPLTRADYIGVSEVLFLPTEDDTLRTLLVRGESGVFRFSASQAPQTSQFSAFAETYDSYFCTASLTIEDNVTVLRALERISARTISVTDTVASLLLYQPGDIDALLRLFSFNPDKLNEHTEPDGTRVFVESHGVLRADMSALTYTAAEDGGVSVSGLIGNEEGTDIYGYLRAASHILRRLGQMNVQYTGGDSSLYLYSVTARDGAISLAFSYRCDNIALVTGSSETVLTITFRGERLIAFTYRMYAVTRMLEEQRLMLPSYVVHVLSPEDTAAVRLIYRVDPAASQGLTAEWMVMPYGAEKEETWAGRE
jgi:hypothetical protein